MAQYVVWLDSEKAFLFNLKTTGIVKTHLEKTVIDHHSRDKHNRHEDPATDRYFHELAAKLNDAEEMLLMGPGLAKTHFKSHLEKHHHGKLAKAVIGVENSDHPTDNQILAEARKFFTTYNLFNHPIG